jgi:hypothetical protein
MSAAGNLFLEGDPFDDPAWQRAALMAGAPPRPSKGYVTCSLAWLARVLPVLRTARHLTVGLLLYRQCLVQRSRTVAFSNAGLADLKIGRQSKYRALALLEEAGAITIEPRNGRAIRVTLRWFP